MLWPYLSLLLMLMVSVVLGQALVRRCRLKHPIPVIQGIGMYQHPLSILPRTTSGRVHDDGSMRARVTAPVEGVVLPAWRERIGVGGPMAALLSKERIVAPPGYQRWRILPTVLRIELSIALGITASVPGDWQRSTLSWTFTLTMLCLGLSAAVGGTWVETAGPRKS